MVRYTGSLVLKPKPEVEFQYGAGLFLQNRNYFFAIIYIYK